MQTDHIAQFAQPDVGSMQLQLELRGKSGPVDAWNRLVHLRPPENRASDSNRSAADEALIEDLALCDWWRRAEKLSGRAKLSGRY